MLVSAGWDVVIDGRDRGSLDAAASSLGAHAFPVAGDVTQASHREALVAEVERLGGIDLLVNNASDLGPSPLVHLEALALDEYERLFESNVLAPLALIQRTLPQLRERGGAIVNVTSDAAVEGYEGWGGYGSTKAALEQLSNVLAAEEPGLRVWWLDPGDMRTEMHQAAFPGEDISDRALPESIAPVVLRLVRERPASGRVRAADLLEGDAR
jgi:NAD(P)-dependent dehydrogenase (short-subunit alcohol dehydrogenase family)